MTNLEFMKDKMKSKIDHMNEHQIARIGDCLIGFPDLCEYCYYADEIECGECDVGFVRWLKAERTV